MFECTIIWGYIYSDLYHCNEAYLWSTPYMLTDPEEIHLFLTKYIKCTSNVWHQQDLLPLKGTNYYIYKRYLPPECDSLINNAQYI